jgi:cobalt-zinc-cadmium efflux system membrane fusion protein
MVDAPSLPEQTRKARVRYVGRQMVAQSNSVPLIADISNADGFLRPGMFVRVSVPAGPPKNVLCLPTAAVVTNEDAKFVFMQESPKSFRRVNVTTGSQNDGWVEIVHGVREGMPVVVQGASALKSELLIGTISKEE